MIVGSATHSTKLANLLNPNEIDVFHGNGGPRKHNGKAEISCGQALGRSRYGCMVPRIPFQQNRQ